MKNIFNKDNIWGVIIALVIGVGIGMYGYSIGDDTKIAGISDVNNGTTTAEDNSSTNGSVSSNTTVDTNPYYMGRITSEKLYVQQMALHHQATIKMSQEVLALNPRNDIATLAKNIISTHASELKALQDWLASWR